MLLLDAGLAYAHFVFAFILVSAVAAEAFVLRVPVTPANARLLLRIDLFYAISAVGVIIAGISRVAWGVKGQAFYAHEPFFWAKMATFAIVGLLSIAPTRAYYRWNKLSRDPGAFAVAEADQKSVRRWVMIEVHLLALVPLFAALMARGIGAP